MALVHPTNGNIWLVAGYSAYMLKTINGGASFQQSNSGINIGNLSTGYGGGQPAS